MPADVQKAPKEVKLIHKKPECLLVVSTAKSRLQEVDGKLERVPSSEGKALQFHKHTVVCPAEDLEALKKKQGNGHMVDWMTVEDWKALRKTDKKQAGAWRRELAENYRIHMGSEFNLDTAEDLIDEIFT